MVKQDSIGVFLLLLGVTLFSLSAILVKKVSVKIHPLAQTVGAMLLGSFLNGEPVIMIHIELHVKK